MSFLLRTAALTSIFCFSLKNCLRTLATPAEFLPPTTIAVGPIRAPSMSGSPSDLAATRSELFFTTWYSAFSAESLLRSSAASATVMPL
jgi:hypothetical protein